MTNFTNEQLEALLNEATSGPWVAKGRYIGTPSHMSYVAEVRDQNGNWSDTAKSRRDAVLIAAAPSLAAALLAERKAREVEVGELRRALGLASVAIDAAYMQSDAEWRGYDNIAGKHDKIVREGRSAIRQALKGPTP